MPTLVTQAISRTSRLIWPSDGEQAGSANFFPAFYLLALVVANHSIFRLGALSFVWTAALIVAVAAVAISIPTIELRAGDIRPIRRVNLLVGFAALAPLIASVVLGWWREFPLRR